MSGLKYGVATHVGLVRENNEDSYAAAPEPGLWLVADGLGGHAGGEVASSIVAGHVTGCVRNGMSIDRAIASSHEAVIAARQDGGDNREMGSTVVAAMFEGDSCFIAWVGDSRAYLWNGAQLEQLTHDHSLVQDLLDQGDLSAEEAAGNPLGNVLTRCVGQKKPASLAVDIEKVGLYRGDRILLCSDGLMNELADGEMESIFLQGDSEQETADGLVKAALDNGGSDNVTVLVVSAPDEAPLRSGCREK